MFAYHHPFPPFFLCHKSPLSASEATSPFPSVFRALKFQIKLGEAEGRLQHPPHASPSPISPSIFAFKPGLGSLWLSVRTRLFLLKGKREKMESGEKEGAEGFWGRKRGPLSCQPILRRQALLTLHLLGKRGENLNIKISGTNRESMF